MWRVWTYVVSIAFVLIMTGVVSAELVGYWKFDEGSGTVAADSSGYGNNGTLKGNPKWAPGKLGNALDFNGNGDYVEIPHNPSLSLTDAITISAWTYMRTTANGEMAIVSKGGWAANDLPYELTETRGDVIFWQFYDNQGRDTCSPNSPSAGEWHHIAGTYDGTIFKCYIDGVLGEEWAYTGKMPQNTASVTIGKRSREAGTYYDGMIDDVAIFNNALSVEEIEAIMMGVGGFGPASAPSPADGSTNPETWATLSWRAGDFAVSHNVYIGENFEDVNAGTGGTFRATLPLPTTSYFVGLGLPGDPYPNGLVPGTTYYWRIDEVNEADPNSPWKGPVWSFLVPPRTAYNPNPADGAESVPLNPKLTWTAGYKAKLHTVYFGDDFDNVSNATSGGTLVGMTAYSPVSLKSAKVYYWRVDETDPPNTYKGQVWSFTTVGAVGNPHPASGADNTEMNAILTWTPGSNAASHQLYFGADKEAVRKATAASPEYKGTKALGTESYDPGLLAWDSAYYWRIDELDNTNAVSKGPLWSFTTGRYLLVEDFESYNDIDPPGAGSNRIFDKWLDGYGTTTNGAVVGNNLPPYAEQGIIHGGKQSMPYAYDTNLKFSEATLTLTPARDWTAQGVTTLSLWFRGASGNAAEKTYVALNGTAAVYNDETSLTQKTTWTQWVIPLQQFADQGVNLANITSITIGLGTKGNTSAAGGTGQMYFDDIRLYRPATP